MPIEEAAGCLALLGRALVGILECAMGATFFIDCVKFMGVIFGGIGRFVVYTMTFGRVSLRDDDDMMAGLVGALAVALLIAVAIMCWPSKHTSRTEELPATERSSRHPC